MKLLITGGAGYVGTVLTQLLLDRGDQMRCFDSLLFGLDPILPFFRHPRYEFVRGDVRNCEQLAQSVRDVDAIIHLAAIVGYPACDRNPSVADEVNVGGARSAQQPVLFASTGSIYGAAPEGFCTEETPTRALTRYGRNKAEAEAMLMDSGNVTCYRFATAFGLSPRLRLDLLVNDFCYQAVTARNLILYEAHFQRSFIHVQDMARAFVHTIRSTTAAASR